VSLQLRVFTMADLEPVNDMLLSAFPGSTPYGPRLREFHGAGIGYTLLAEDDGTLVGMGTILDYKRSGYIAHVGVDPALQGRGTGRRLMEGLLAESRRRRHKFVELQSTEAGYKLYLSLGFIVARETFAFGGGMARETGDTVTTAAIEDRAAVAKLDADAFGADRGTTVAHWFDDPEATLLAHREGRRITGFIAARRGRIGPWLAANDRVAARLLDAMLLRRPQQLPVFAAADAAMRILAERGFTQVGRNRHMIWGAKRPPSRPHVYGLITLSQG
jgi:GNAT superfamily N-acetyltransferase